ncbi:hypothetical protein [Streptacidiphilus monticola]|uniref:Uncharacterized protein n=1 Tax=Streptacidiphilus monticola TaxID=2161674 RepID=A0ABW1G161_9ACTN
MPHDWAVASADGVTTADAPGLGRLSLRARIVDEHPTAPDDPGVGLRNGGTLHVADSTAPAPQGSTRRIRRWDIVQPLGDQVRLFTFTFDYDATGHHAEAVAVLDREIRTAELGSL